MGLDMYLEKKVSGYLKPDHTLSTDYKYKVENKFGGSNWTTIETQAMYWRKVNHIHRWFVDNVQDGVDDCGKYDVTIDQLLELRERCMETIKVLDGRTLRVPKDRLEFFKKCKDDPNMRGAVSKKATASMKVDISNLETLLEKLSNEYLSIPTDIKEKVAEILPTQSGCFFGTTEYTVWYFVDNIKTILAIDEALKDTEKNADDDFAPYIEFSYTTSW